jgi:DNA-directed RNA polymerase subunit RPC12/RpoP
MVEKSDYVRCSRCGKQVSNRTGKEMVVRAWVECPECIQGTTGSEQDLGVKQHRIFRWGNYIFNFPSPDEETLLETAANTRAMRTEQKVDWLPSVPVLRPGIIMEDEEGHFWEVASVEPIFFPPCRLKGTSRFDSPEGVYSPWGWTIYRYKIKKVR